jgi:protein-disulfide isomerase
LSGRKDRERRREERLRHEEQAKEGERRRRIVQLASALAFVAIAVVAVLVVISQSQTDGGDTELEGGEQVTAGLAGIPQRGLVLGKPTAPVTLVEFGDLRCPVCKGVAEEILPEVIDSKVRSGEAKLEFRNFSILGPESDAAAAAAVAAARQNRGWSFVELFYRNQGFETTPYVTDEFLTAIARAARVPDIPRWNRERRSAAASSEVSRDVAAAERLGFEGTPSFAVRGAATGGLQPLGTPGSAGELESAIDSAG